MNIPTKPNLPEGDWFREMLDGILGAGWEVAWTNGGAPSGLIAELAMYMNTVALTVVTVLMVWICACGVVTTSYSGKTLGEQYSTIWVPIRCAVSVISLAPISHGLSLIQIAILFCSGWGLTLANNVWQVGLDYMVERPAEMTATAPPNLRQNTEELAAGVLEILTWQQYLIKELDSTMPDASLANIHRQQAKPGRHARVIIQFVAPSPDWLRLEDMDMGAVIIECPGGLNETACLAREQALRRLVKDLEYAAISFGELTRPQVGIMTRAIRQYEQTMLPVLSGAADRADPVLMADVRKFAQASKRTGWASAGSWLMTFSGHMERIQEIAHTLPSIIPPNRERLAAHGYRSLAWVLEAYKTYQEREIAHLEEVALRKTSAENNFIRELFAGWTIDVIKIITSEMKQGDPLLNLVRYGHDLLGMGEAAVLASAVSLGAAEGAQKTVSGIPLIGGMLGGPLKGSVTGLSILMAGLVFPAILGLFTAGFLLAFALPFTAFFVWTYGVIVYGILIIEALLCAPLWAGAHAMPEGDGLAGRHGQAGYFLLLGLITRPVLMVVGFLMSSILLGLVIKFVSKAFTLFFVSSTTDITAGLATCLAMLVLLGLMYVYITHHVFKFCIQLPDNFLRWIGHGEAGLNVDKADSETRAAVGAVSNRTESGATAAMKGKSKGTPQKDGKGEIGDGVKNSKKGASDSDFV